MVPRRGTCSRGRRERSARRLRGLPLLDASPTSRGGAAHPILVISEYTLLTKYLCYDMLLVVMGLEAGGGILFLSALKHTKPGLSATRTSKLDSPSSPFPVASPRLISLLAQEP